MRSDNVYSLGSYLVSFFLSFFFLFHMFHCGTDTTLHSLPCVILGATYRIPNLEAEPVFSWRKKKSWQQSKPFSYSFHPNSLEDVEVWSSKHSLQQCVYVCLGNLNILKTSWHLPVVIYFLLLCMVINIWNVLGITLWCDNSSGGNNCGQKCLSIYLHFSILFWTNPIRRCEESIECVRVLVRSRGLNDFFSQATSSTRPTQARNRPDPQLTVMFHAVSCRAIFGQDWLMRISGHFYLLQSWASAKWLWEKKRRRQEKKKLLSRWKMQQTFVFIALMYA